MMTRSQAVAVATAVQQVRPEWDHPGILAALQAPRSRRPDLVLRLKLDPLRLQGPMVDPRVYI